MVVESSPYYRIDYVGGGCSTNGRVRIFFLVFDMEMSREMWVLWVLGSPWREKEKQK